MNRIQIHSCVPLVASVPRPSAPRTALTTVLISSCVRHMESKSVIEVGKEPFADANLLAIVAAERLVKEKLVICHTTKQALQDFLHPQGFRWMQGVVFVEHLSCYHQLF